MLSLRDRSVAHERLGTYIGRQPSQDYDKNGSYDYGPFVELFDSRPGNVKKPGICEVGRNSYTKGGQDSHQPSLPRDSEHTLRDAQDIWLHLNLACRNAYVGTYMAANIINSCLMSLPR